MQDFKTLILKYSAHAQVTEKAARCVQDLHLIENDWKMVHKKLFCVNRPLQ